MKNADENELRSIATDPDDIHMFNVADFSFLLEIVDNLSDNLCNSVKGPGLSEFGSYLAYERKQQQILGTSVGAANKTITPDFWSSANETKVLLD